MQALLNHLACVIATLMEIHFKELDLNPELLLLNKEEMIVILMAKCLSHYSSFLGVEAAVHKSNPTDLNEAGSSDLLASGFLKDLVPQVMEGNTKSFIKSVHCYLVETRKEREAEEYLNKVSPVSKVEHLESIKMWNYRTLPFQIHKGMEDMGLGLFPCGSFFNPPSPRELFVIPPSGWKPGRAATEGNNPGTCQTQLNETLENRLEFDSTDEAGTVAEVEDSTSTAVESNPVGLVLHVGEVTDQPTMDAAAEDNKKTGVMEGEDEF